MDLVLLLVRLFLFGVFMLAGIGKLFDLEGAEKSVKEFGTPATLARGLAVALPIVEIAVAILFLFVETSWIGAVAGTVVLLSFTAAMVRQVVLGRTPDCHCFGQIHSEPVGAGSLVRNIVFTSLALFLAVRGRDGQGLPISENTSLLSTALILIVGSLLVVSAVYLKKIFERQTEILRRLEILEVISHDGRQVERQGAGDPHDRLPIGSPFPDFNLPNLAGRKVGLRDLLTPAKPVLFLFVSPTCEPCAALLPDFQEWHRELEGKVDVVLVSSGSTEANAKKFGAEFEGEILLQEKREIADLVRALWTPTALLVRGDGAIASHLAAGDTAIRKLVDQVRTENLAKEHFFVTNGDNKPREPKIGERVPNFSLKSVNGEEITDDVFTGRKTLVVFWSQRCPYCTAMMSDLQTWDHAKNGADPGLLVFSDSETDEHAGLDLRSPFVIDEGYKTAEKFGMMGTPSAVLVDDQGTIVTETAVGASNIWALIGRRD